jgi:hypothetical protein
MITIGFVPTVAAGAPVAVWGAELWAGVDPEPGPEAADEPDTVAAAVLDPGELGGVELPADPELLEHAVAATTAAMATAPSARVRVFLRMIRCLSRWELQAVSASTGACRMSNVLSAWNPDRTYKL